MDSLLINKVNGAVYAKLVIFENSFSPLQAENLVLYHCHKIVYVQWQLLGRESKRTINGNHIHILSSPKPFEIQSKC